MDDAALAAWLCSAAAVRERCTGLLDVALGTGLPNMAVDLARLPACADYTAAVIRRNYPTLDIPHHARWRHFATGGVDRWEALRANLRGLDAAALARTRIDLCVVSVLLDAGAGPEWRYRDGDTGQVLARSEGLAVASLAAFRAGLFSAEGLPQADAAGLMAVDAAALGQAFQVAEGNALAGLEGRAALMRDLGAAVLARPDLFAGSRIGGLYDVLAPSGTVGAAALLGALLDGLGPAWPSRIVMAGRSLGDVWPHPAAPGDGLVPFHKLSQWLAYSLIEVFGDAGVPVTGIAELTGLPEYRNGGLLLDLSVLRLHDPALALAPLPVGHPAVVEWRALTVALLDWLAPLIRERLGRDEASLPLSRILEGGTWAAGRAVAAERRPGGGPPLQVVSDGTVF
jgi:Protein of unknown function (DUF1688)